MRIALLAAALVCLPLMARAEPAPISCTSAVEMATAHQDQALVNYATDLYSTWDAQAEANGQPPVGIPLGGFGDAQINFWLNSCLGDMSLPLAAVIHTEYNVARAMEGG